MIWTLMSFGSERFEIHQISYLSFKLDDAMISLAVTKNEQEEPAAVVVLTSMKIGKPVTAEMAVMSYGNPESTTPPLLSHLTSVY